MTEYDHWNYRVLSRSQEVLGEVDEWYELIEAYYDTEDKIVAYTGDPATPGGGSLAELADDLKQMSMVVDMADFLKDVPKHKVLTVEDLPGQKMWDEVEEDHWKALALEARDMLVRGDYDSRDDQRERLQRFMDMTKDAAIVPKKQQSSA